MSRRDDSEFGKLSRRKFLKQSSKVAFALPFTLLVPSNSRAVITSATNRAPFAKREEDFARQLSKDLAQTTRPPGVGPGTGGVPPPMPYNTNFDTSVNTPHTFGTQNGDFRQETIFDGTESDWKTDYR